jgi:hypothetical protein
MSEARAASGAGSGLVGRLVDACAGILNLVECFDELQIEPQGEARKHAEAGIKALGPAAVGAAVIQGSPGLQESGRASEIVGLFVEGARRRRRAILEALPGPQRIAVERREREREVPRERVLGLFLEALSRSAPKERLRRWGSGGGLALLKDAVTSLSKGEAPDAATVEGLKGIVEAERGGAADPDPATGTAVESPGPAPAPAAAPAPGLEPAQLLGLVGGALSALGADEAALERAMAGTLPQRAPEGYASDAGGTIRRDVPKVGRNDPCPCGTGQKYKKCHGK